MKKYIIAGLCLLSGSLSFSQTATEVDSKVIIENGAKLHDDKKYDEAIAEYKKVNRNDTNYALSLIELAYSYSASGKDSLGVLACEELLKIPSLYAPRALLYKGNLLDNMKKSDEAVKCYEEGMKKYPASNSFYYEYGLLNYNKGKYKEAHELFVKSIRHNPYHANSHLMMGYLAIKQGKLIPAILALQFYLVLDNSSERAQQIVGELEGLAKIDYEFKDAVKVEGLSEQDDFGELESLVRSKIALGAKYKSITRLKYNLSKQLQLISEKMVVNKEDQGFYMQFYAPIIAEQFKLNYFEPYSYDILGGMKIEDVDKWIKKHEKEASEWGNWFGNYIGKNYCIFEAELNGKKTDARHWYSNSFKLAEIGNIDATGKNTGYWNYYFSTGILKSEGAYNDKGERDGTWKYYDAAGRLKTVERFTGAKLAGKAESYYKNGSISIAYNYLNGLMDGTIATYYPTGVEKAEYIYKSGVQTGKEKQFHKTGKLEYEIAVVNEKYEGNYVLYYPDGHIKEKVFFKEGKIEGKSETYFQTPENQLKTVGFYQKGNLTGDWNSFYQNGKLEETGSCDKEGNKTGIWKAFYDDGTLKSEESFSKGKNDGIAKYYASSGKLTEEFLYKNNLLQEYKAYDNAGKIVYQNKKEGKSDYDVLLYYANGNKRKEGKIVKGENEGVWKDYERNGYVTSEVSYSAGKKQGKSIDYYETGKVESELDYVDGETNGYYKEYYKNGQLKREGAYVSDKEMGLWKGFYQNGKKEYEVFYKDGEYDGWQTYFAVNGKIDYEDFVELGYFKTRLTYDTVGKVFETINFDKGSANFNLKYFTGKKRLECVYKNNIIQGGYKAYYPDGKLWVERKYVDGDIEGEAKFYYPDTKLKTSNTYLNGLLNGTETDYFENGNTKSKVDYVYGDKTGNNLFYYSNKQLETSSVKKDDKTNGKYTMYDELTGEVMLEATYENNYLMSYTYKDKSGKFIAPIEIKNETGTIKAYYPNGNVSIEYTLKSGYRNGKRTKYYSNGKERTVENYTFGELNGVSKSYYPSGKIKGEEAYSNDEKNGKSVYYFESGKIKAVEFYLNGEEQGTFKYYDESGKLIHTYVYYNGEMVDEF